MRILDTGEVALSETDSDAIDLFIAWAASNVRSTESFTVESMSDFVRDWYKLKGK